MDGGVRPDPREYGLFASAVAKRYGGHYAGLPRVRYWQAWNEPSLFSFLVPQYNTPFSSPVTTASRPVSPQIYAPLVNAFAASVHRVHRDNLVIAGGLPPFARSLSARSDESSGRLFSASSTTAKARS